MELKEKIQQAENKLAEAIASQQPEKVAALYTEDARFLPDGGQTIKGRADVRSFFESIFAQGIVAGEFITSEVDQDGLNVSEIGKFSLFVRNAGGQLESVVSGRYFVLWKKVDGVWLLHRDVVSRDKAD